MVKMFHLKDLQDFEELSVKSTQGKVGKGVKDGTKVIWKLANIPDFTCQSEHMVSRTIQQSNLRILPHFMKTVDYVYGTLDERSYGRPCVVVNEVQGGRLDHVIHNCRGESKDVVSVLMQLLLAIAAGQEEMELTHYDLHVENVMVRTTTNDIHVYIFPDGRVYPVETEGLCPVIIDYGYTYTNKASYVLPSVYFNSSGFTTLHSDPLADPIKLLCTTVSMFRDTSKLKRAVEDIFKPLTSLDLEHGWIEGYRNTKKMLVKELRPILPDIRSTSIFRHIPDMVDIIQTLIPLPITTTADATNFRKHYTTFYYHWFKVEEDLGNKYLEMLWLHKFVEAIREDKDPKYEVELFLNRGFEVDYDEMRVCIRSIAAKIQNVYKDIVDRNMATRNTMYKKLPVTNALDVYNMVKSAITIYGKDDKVKVFDLRDGTVRRLTITKDQAKRLNKKRLTIESLVL